jgi:hypothetical protein
MLTGPSCLLLTGMLLELFSKIYTNSILGVNHPWVTGP